MKILMVAMPSLHFFRWTEQLKDAGHEVYWFDVVDGGNKVERINWVHQIVGWKLRWDFPGRHFIKKNFPKYYQWIQQFNERNTATVFEQKLLEIEPDVVHSFALYVACAPIIGVMEKHKNIKWIYSSWGSDLFYFQYNPAFFKDIKRVLPRIDFLFTDCNRDFVIAKTHGFSGEFLGVFPGGGGFPLAEMNRYALPFEQRKTMLIKGFQGRSGRAIPVLKALEQLKEPLHDYKIVVFGADEEVLEYTANSELVGWGNFAILGKISQNEVWQLMGKSIIYIGNSNSDGIANTLLEAICMDVFPIQSNPGGVTEEVITDGINGMLIEDCEDVAKIKNKISIVLNSTSIIQNALHHNKNVKENLNDQKIRSMVLKNYDSVMLVVN
jgi:glycosyltransferase involved in cell wall biosynthesis